jgi:hypothetical protein
MKRTPTLLLLFLAASALALSSNDDGYSWRKASNTERKELAKTMTDIVRAPYSYMEMYACLNESLADPVKPYIHGQKIVDVAAVCHAMIKNMAGR